MQLGSATATVTTVRVDLNTCSFTRSADKLWISSLHTCCCASARRPPCPASTPLDDDDRDTAVALPPFVPYNCGNGSVLSLGAVLSVLSPLSLRSFLPCVCVLLLDFLLLLLSPPLVLFFAGSTRHDAEGGLSCSLTAAAAEARSLSRAAHFRFRRGNTYDTIHTESRDGVVLRRASKKRTEQDPILLPCLGGLQKCLACAVRSEAAAAATATTTATSSVSCSSSAGQD